MQYVYAAMLLHSAKKEVSESAVEKILSAAGLETDKAKIKALVEALKEVNIDDVIKQASVMAVAAPAVSAGAAPAAKAEPKEEKKTEEEAAAGLGSLFG
jgi:large subunit ribosomal protein L12